MTRKSEKQTANNFQKKHSNTIWGFVFFTLTVLSISNFLLYIKPRPNITYAKNDTSDQKITLWKSFLDSHPDYYEGWIELTKLELKRGDKKEAKTAFTKAFNIKPNSEEVEQLKVNFVAN